MVTYGPMVPRAKKPITKDELQRLKVIYSKLTKLQFSMLLRRNEDCDFGNDDDPLSRIIDAKMKLEGIQGI